MRTLEMKKIQRRGVLNGRYIQYGKTLTKVLCDRAEKLLERFSDMRIWDFAFRFQVLLEGVASKFIKFPKLPMLMQPIEFDEEMSRKMARFTHQTRLRSFRIKTTTHTIFVNISYLAEISEYFNCVASGNFTETNNNEITFADIETEDLVMFLAYVCPENFVYDKKIDDKNIFILSHLADRFIFPYVKNEIRRWLDSDEFKNAPFSTPALVESALLFNSQGYRSDEMEPIYRKLALLEDEVTVAAFQNVPEPIREDMLANIRAFRPYNYERRPISMYDWRDFRARIFF